MKTTWEKSRRFATGSFRFSWVYRGVSSFAVCLSAGPITADCVSVLLGGERMARMVVQLGGTFMGSGRSIVAWPRSVRASARSCASLAR